MFKEIIVQKVTKWLVAKWLYDDKVYYAVPMAIKSDSNFSEFEYQVMALDKKKMDAYCFAMKGNIEGKRVVVIGDGSLLPLTLIALDAGAMHVYMIEQNERTFARAKKLGRKLGINDKVSFIQGWSTELELPERVDVCVSEIIGSIGSSEKVIPTLRDAKRRFLKTNGLMIPCRNETQCVPMESVNSGNLTLIQKLIMTLYTWGQQTRCYDVYNCRKDAFIASAKTVEYLDFQKAMYRFVDAVSFTITRDGVLNGFLLYNHLHVSEQCISTRTGTSWSGVFVPVSERNVKKGDTLAINIHNDGITITGIEYDSSYIPIA